MQRIRWKVRRAGSGWQGEIHLPEGFMCAAKGATKPKALGKAAALADKVLSNPALQALLPPQAQIALKGAKLLAKYGNPIGLQATLAKKAFGKLRKLF